MQLTINDHDAVSSAAVVVLSLNPSIHTHTAAAAAAAEAAAKEAEEAKFNKKEAESIADDLKHHDLADGNYYSSHDIEAIIK